MYRPNIDPLSEVVTLLRPTAAVSKPITARDRWSVSYKAYDAPGFTLILEGAAWITFDGRAPLRLTKGDFLLLPTTPAFTLGSEPGLPGSPVEPSSEIVRHGSREGEPDFIALGGSFTFERGNTPLLLSLLPAPIHIPASIGKSTRFGRIVELLAQECGAHWDGKDLIVQRLLEILLIEALRWRDASLDSTPETLGRGLRDVPLARAIRAMHAEVRANWTVASLAEIAGMSRSAFSDRFGKAMGFGPIEYLTRWRMALAKDALIVGAKTLDQIAEDIGYESASAFSTAFRKRLGCPPGKFARSHGLA